jgi:D-lyxose ketol-isomerase
MKRSEIDAAIDAADALFRRHGFRLPPFAFLDAEALRERLAAPGSEIRRGRLGWDVSDFGSGDFATTGIVAFTIRNGDQALLQTGRGRIYCEKALMVREGQWIPNHTHVLKTEDLINRGDSTVLAELTVAPGRSVPVLVDDRRIEVAGTTTVRLAPGEGVTLEPGVWHRIGSEGGDAFIIEVSLVNDDQTDNIFRPPLPRFPDIEEDAAPRRLICPDYA